MNNQIDFILNINGKLFKTNGGTCFINYEKNRLEIGIEVKQPAPVRDVEFYVPIEFFGRLKELRHIR